MGTPSDTTKPVIYWLLLLQGEGYSWAEKAIENTEHKNLNELVDEQYVLYVAFNWERSPEGFEYWYAANQSLVKL